MTDSFFFSSRRRHTRLQGDWSSDVCSSDLEFGGAIDSGAATRRRDRVVAGKTQSRFRAQLRALVQRAVSRQIRVSGRIRPAAPGLPARPGALLLWRGIAAVQAWEEGAVQTRLCSACLDAVFLPHARLQWTLR